MQFPPRTSWFPLVFYHVLPMFYHAVQWLPQAEFSKFVRFEDGAVVAPEDVEIFERSGDLVGALSFHPPNGDVRFPLEETYYWFSLSGPCPNMKNGEKSSSNCSKYQKGLVPEKKSQYVAGGLCKPKLFSSDIPDGTPGCSYYIENYTTKNLDEIAGITQEDCGGRKCSSWSDFRLHCSNQNLSFTHLGVKYCKEYDYPGLTGAFRHVLHIYESKQTRDGGYSNYNLYNQLFLSSTFSR